MCDFKVGDEVKIIKPGQTYSSYEIMFSICGFKNCVFNSEWEKGEIGVIFSIKKHLSHNNEIILSLRNNNGKECLICDKGVELNLKRKNSFKLKRKNYDITNL